MLRLIGRRIAHAVAVGEAVVVLTTALKGVVQAEVVPHFVDEHSVLFRVNPEKLRFANHAIFRLAVGGREISIARYPRPGRQTIDTLNNPYIDITSWIPAIQVFEGQVIRFHVHLGQRGLDAGNARGWLPIGRATGETILYAHIYAFARLPEVTGMSKCCVQVLNSRQYLGIADVFGAAVVDNVHDDGQGHAAAGCGIFFIFLLKKLRQCGILCCLRSGAVGMLFP